MRYLPLALLLGCGRIGFDEQVGAPLVLDAPTQMNLNTTAGLAVIGGLPPYRFTLAAGTGELTGAAFRSPAFPGSAVVEVRDALDDTAGASIAFGGDYIYAAGGFVSMLAIDSVWRSRDGAQWELAGRLPIPRTGGALLVFEDQLLFLGGATMPDGTPGDHVWSSRDGASWTQIGVLPETRELPAAAVYRGRIWVGAGIRMPGAAYTTSMWSSADGVSWQPEPALPSPIHGNAFVPWRDELLSIAGHEATGQVDSIHAFDGTSWRQIGAVPVAGEYHATTVIDDELWVAGGLGLRDRVAKTSDGSTFADLAPLPAPRNWGRLFWHADEVWMVSGVPAQPLHSIDGNVWTAAGTPPATGVDSAALVQFTPR